MLNTILTKPPRGKYFGGTVDTYQSIKPTFPRVRRGERPVRQSTAASRER